MPYNMALSMKVVAIIPARIASTRLPRKILREIAGQTMLQRVYEAARGCSALADVIVATDSNEILSVCERNGWAVPSGSTAKEELSKQARKMELPFLISFLIELILMQHTECGVGGLAEQQPDALAGYFDVPADQLGSLAPADPHEGIRVDLEALAGNLAVPGALSLTGLVFDVATGEVELVERRAPLRDGD